MKIALATALDELSVSNQLFIELFQHGSLSVELYKPVGKDEQQPHDRDEVYVVVSGSGDFINGGTTTSFQPGDFLFVPAGVEHRFVNFTDDFATWVIFYGPVGGEAAGNTNGNNSTR